MLDLARQNPEFRKLWAAQIVSGAGDWLSRVALLGLIGSLAGQEAAVGGLGLLFAVELAIRFLPYAVLGPISGPMADRFSRRALMVWADLLRAGIALGFLAVDRPSELPWLYALLVAQVSISTFFDAARTAALPDTVRPEQIFDAHALTQATWSLMLTLGSIGGALLVLAMPLGSVFVLDSATFLVSALLIAKVRLPRTPVDAHPFRWQDLLSATDLRRGLRHARSLGLGPVLLAKVFWGPAGGYLVLLSVAGSGRFGRLSPDGTALGAAASAGGFATGVLLAARGVGTGFGPIASRRWFGTGERALWRQITFGFALAAVAYALFAAAHDLAWAALWVAVAHLGGGSIWVASTAWWQRRVESGFRGRVYALEFLGMTLSFTAWAFVAGWIHDLTGSLEAAAWTMSGLVLALGLAWNRLARPAAE